MVKRMSSVVFLSVVVLFSVGCMEMSDDSTSQAVSTSFQDAVVTSQWGQGAEIHSTLSDHNTGTVQRAVYLPNQDDPDTWDLVIVENGITHEQPVMSVDSPGMTLELANQYFYGHCRGQY